MDGDTYVTCDAHGASTMLVHHFHLNDI